MSLYTHFDHYKLPIGPDGTPYEYLEALRDEAMQTNTPIGWSEEYGGFWVCAGYAEGKEIFMQPEVFSSRDVVWPEYALPGGRRMMLSGYDEPEHMKYRKLIQNAFTARAAQDMAEYFRRDTNFLIDQFIDAGRVDAVKELQQVPGRMTAMLFGLPPEAGKDYRTWINAVSNQARTDPQGAAPHLEAMKQQFQWLLAERRRDPGDDIFSMFVKARYDGDRPLTDEEIEDLFVVMLIGAIDNTVYIIGNMLWRLGWDIELRRRLIRHPELLKTLPDEAMRVYGPAQVHRVALRDVSIGDVTIRAGQHVALALPLMNRDPRQFPDADLFKPDRKPNQHVGLGYGLHHCIGAFLIRVELQIVLEEFLRRIPYWELDPDRPARWQSGQVIGLVSVPIIFPPGGGEPRTGWRARAMQGTQAADAA